MMPTVDSLANRSYGLTKDERICSRRLVEKLFGGSGSRTMSAYPLRLVYMTVEKQCGAQAQILVSVPKKHFKHAVDRNRVKRQLREAYRHNKHILLDVLGGRPDTALALAFVWQAKVFLETDEVAKKMIVLLTRVAEKITRDGHNNEKG